MTDFQRWLDKDGGEWRANPEVPGEFQILIRDSRAWSDADLGPEDGPFMQACGVSGCRICPEVLYDYADVLAIEDRRR